MEQRHSKHYELVEEESYSLYDKALDNIRYHNFHVNEGIQSHGRERVRIQSERDHEEKSRRDENLMNNPLQLIYYRQK
jgi:hypothetical protein